jgi:Family of unknown function (DUF6523)
MKSQQKYATTAFILFLFHVTCCTAFFITSSDVVVTTSLSFISCSTKPLHLCRLSSTTPKKGFGNNEKEVETKKVDKPKSVGAQQRDQGSKKYDEIASLGGQEYRIFVRQFGSSDQSWLPCGLIAVPRGSQVSDAIYSNVSELQKAIVRTYPKLKGMEIEFEYGFNLKIYPDDPIEVAKNSGPNTDNNIFSFGGWMKSLLSPIDTSNVKRPPTV